MKNVLSRALIAMALVAMPVSVSYAQNIDLAAGGADLIWNGTAAGANAGRWLDQGPLSPGDNRRDLVIGSPGDGSIAGRVDIIFAGPVLTGSLSLDSSSVRITGGAVGDGFGTATAVGPITVNDTSMTSNLVIGAPGALSGRGVVYVFPTPMNNGVYNTSHAVFTIQGAPGDQLGAALATADINDDGYREIVIGAPGNGRIYVISGGSHLTGTRDLNVTGGDLLITGTGIGSVIQAGDVTGDGVFEILVGSAALNTVYLLTGSFPDVTNLPVGADAVFTGIDPGDEVGASLRIADIDADGRRDIVIGAPSADGPGNTRGNSGEAYVLWGKSSFSSMSLASADLTFHGAAAGQRFAEALSAGDINRDTPNDLVFIVPNASAAGELYVFYGRDRGSFGVDVGGGLRVVDLASVGASRRIIGDPAAGPIVSAQVFEVTGEGARDIIVGAPTNDSSKGAVFFTISPRMSAVPTSLAVTLTQGHNTTRQIDIHNVSTIAVTFTTSDNATWLSITPGSGSSVSGTPQATTVTLNASGLTPGTYNGSISYTSTSPHLTMTSTVPVTLTVEAGTPPPSTHTLRKSDFSGDGTMDLLWHNTVEGYLAIWSLNGTTLVSSDLLTPNRMTDPNWKIVGTGDFNGDDKPDIVWQEQTEGWIGIWLMNGTTLMSSTTLAPSTRERVSHTNWKIAGVVDINNDTKPDLLWQEQTEGWLVAWLLDGLTVTASVALNPERIGDTTWKIVGSGDFNGDNMNDLIWQNMSTGYLAAWFMNGLNLIDSVLLSPNYVTDTNWKIVAVGDVDVDGKLDLVWRDDAGGWLAIWLMNGTSLISSLNFNPERVADTNWKIVGPK